MAIVKKYLVKEATLRNFLESVDILMALEELGVDNWEGSSEVSNHLLGEKWRDEFIASLECIEKDEGVDGKA